MNKTPELLPCPFCGGSADYYVSGLKGYVYCTGCGARTDGSYVYRDPDWAQKEARSWSQRVYPPEVIKDYFRKLLSVNCKCGTPIIADKKICPKCGQNWSDYE